jgi:hypothetical protein
MPNNERVPLFGTWRTAYFVVVLAFLFDVALFYVFQRYFS